MNLFEYQDKSRDALIPNYAWMDEEEINFVLVTQDNLAGVIDSCIDAGKYALDLETEGLNMTVSEDRTTHSIVGICLSHDGNTGYYIPVRHKDPYSEHNLPWSVVHKEMQRLISSDSVAVFHNGMFDCEFLQFNGTGPLGEWDIPKKFEDTLVLAYLADTRRKRKGLKHLSKELLGMEMIELKDLFSALEDHSKKRYRPDKDFDFSKLDPSWGPTIKYAGSDAICTYRLHEHLEPKVKSPGDGQMTQKLIYKVEKGGQAANRWMERAGVRVDRDGVLTDLIRIGQRDWFACLHEVYLEVSKELERDIRPGWFRIFCGEVDGLPGFDPKKVDEHNPFNVQVDDARKLAKHRNLDSAEPDLEKLVPSLTDSRLMEKVSFPARYDVQSASQLGLMLRELGVDGLEVTEKSGQIKTSNDVMTKIIESAGEDLVYMKKIEKLRSNSKALGTYLLPLYQDARPETDRDGNTIWCVRAGFNPYRADTGRFTARTSRKPQEDGGTRVTFHGLPSGYDKSKPECLLRIKEALIPRSGKIIVACVAEGTLVSTSEGLIPIETVTPGAQVWTEKGLCSVTAATKTGRRETVSVTTERGHLIQVTPDHLVRTVTPTGLGWKPAGDLSEGDWVVQVHGNGHREMSLPKLKSGHFNENPIVAPSEWSEKLAFFLGWFVGDGCVSHKHGTPKCVGISMGDDIEELPQLNRLASDLFGPGITFTHADKGDVLCGSTPLARWLLEITNKKSSHDACVPAGILQGPDSHKRAFLRGWLDADGSVSARAGDGVSGFTVSSLFSQQIQLLFQSQGILSRRVFVDRISNFGPNQGWLISVRGIQSLNFLHQRVGFSLPRKKERLEALVSVGRNRDFSEVFPRDLAIKAVLRQRNPETNRIYTNGNRKGRVSRQALERASTHVEDCDPQWMDFLLNSGIHFDTVTSVTPGPTLDVWDLTVPEARQFQAGGLLVHNCDYAGVELRVVTALSREPLWMEQYFRCSSCDHQFEKPGPGATPTWIPPFCPTCGSDKIGDIHTLTAQAIYGEGVTAHDDFKNKRQKAKCVHPDTIIVTALGDHGPQPMCIGTLPVGEIDEFEQVTDGLKVAVSRDSYAEMQTYNGGVKPLYHVVSRRGILTCSAQHRIQLMDGTLASIDQGLEKGMNLAQPKAPVFSRERGNFPTLKYRPHTQVPATQVQTNEDLAYFSGLFLGDGSKSGTSSVGIVHGHVSKTDQTGTSYSEMQEIIEGACAKAGFSPVLRDEGVYLGSRNVMRFLAVLGLVEGTEGGRVLRVPNWIIQSNHAGILPFLGGLFDTDGTVSLRDGSARWLTKDAVFAGQVAALIHGMGITPSVEACWNKTYERFYYRVGISGSQASWLKPHMRHPGKKLRFKEGVKPHPRIHNPVLAVIPAGEYQCVDLSVSTEDHLYWANGMTVHNSVNFALCYGGSGRAVERATGVDENEGARIKQKFDNNYTVLAQWWWQMRKYAHRYGYVPTAMGRRCSLMPDIKLPKVDENGNSNKGFIRKAERNAVNAPIQGCLHPKSRVMTSTGYLSIKELWDRQQEGAPDLKIWTGRTWESGRVLESGIKNHHLTTFKNGTELHTSPDHLIRTWRNSKFEWVKQEDLLEGEWVAFNASSERRESFDLGYPHEGQALQYDWQQVDRKEDMNSALKMYDIEVFDEDHAFVCDGVIVHNSSADITKSAMFFIYKECKKRGWLDKIHMLATIHDELVFEVDLDILEEGVEMIETQMARNPLIMALKWPVPLTLDTEIGTSWKVKWNLLELKMGKEEWPELLKDCFQKKYIEYDAPPSMDLPEGTKLRLEVGQDQKQVVEPDSGPDDSGSDGFDVPEAAESEDSYYDGKPNPKEFIFELRTLDIGSAVKLAELVTEAKNSGLTRVHFSYRGSDLTPDFEKQFGGPLWVNHQILTYLRRKFGMV